MLRKATTVLALTLLAVAAVLIGPGSVQADRPSLPLEAERFLEDPSQAESGVAEVICSPKGRLVSLTIDGKVSTAGLAALVRGCQQAASGSAAAQTLYTRTCYSEYVGRSTARLALYKLWVRATAYVTTTVPGGKIISFADPPSYGAQTYVVGWQYSSLRGDAYWFSYPYQIKAYATADFAYKLFGVTWSQATRWVWADLYHKDGLTICRPWAY
jgi:hypothetical protein